MRRARNSFLSLNIGRPTIPNPQGQIEQRPSLLVILGNQLVLVSGVLWPLKGFALGEKEYRDAGYGNWTGFYDWLRDAHEKVVGVRYTPFEETEFLIEYARKFPYVSVASSKHLEIFFYDKRAFEPQLSADQDFEYDAVFRSDDREYAFAFGTGWLSESSLRSLDAYGSAHVRRLE